MKLNKQTLSEQIYQILRQDILQQDLACGTKLTLKTLQERFEVSSTPIREALTRLVEEGLMSYYSNVGVRVLTFSREDLIEIYSFMGDLDALALRYAAENAKIAELKAKLSDNISKCEEICGKSNELPQASSSEEIGRSNKQPQASSSEEIGKSNEQPQASSSEEIGKDSGNDEFLPLSDDFHLLFYQYCGNSRLTRAAEKLRSQLSVAAYQYEKTSQNQNAILIEHREIMEAFLADETEKAAERMKKHLLHSMEHAFEIFGEM